MEEDIAGHRQRSIKWIVGPTVPKNGTPDARFRNTIKSIRCGHCFLLSSCDETAGQQMAFSESQFTKTIEGAGCYGETVSVPTKPASACPGTVHKKT
jgi:hypothetical protein